MKINRKPIEYSVRYTVVTEAKTKIQTIFVSRNIMSLFTNPENFRGSGFGLYFSLVIISIISESWNLNIDVLHSHQRDKEHRGTSCGTVILLSVVPVRQQTFYPVTSRVRRLRLLINKTVVHCQWRCIWRYMYFIINSNIKSLWNYRFYTYFYSNRVLSRVPQ